MKEICLNQNKCHPSILFACSNFTIRISAFSHNLKANAQRIGKVSIILLNQICEDVAGLTHQFL